MVFVLLVLSCLEGDPNAPRADVAVLALFWRKRPLATIELHFRRAGEQDIIESDRMRALRRTEAHARSLGRCLLASGVGGRQPALATYEGLDGGGDEVFGITWRAQDVGRGALATRRA